MKDIVKVKKTEKTENPDATEKKTRIDTRLLPWILVLIVLIGGAGVAYYYKKQADEVKSDPAAVQQQKNQAETDRVLVSLKKILLITEQEKPTVARIEDPAKLQSSNKDFYKDVQKGDYLIIFPKRAIVFRESNNQIINIAPIVNTADLKSTEGTAPASETPTPTPVQ